MARAKELDDYQAKYGRTLGPLHGLPVSLKGQFHVKGVDTSMEYTDLIGGNCGVVDPIQYHKIEKRDHERATLLRSCAVLQGASTAETMRK